MAVSGRRERSERVPSREAYSISTWAILWSACREAQTEACSALEVGARVYSPFHFCWPSLVQHVRPVALSLTKGRTTMVLCVCHRTVKCFTHEQTQSVRVRVHSGTLWVWSEAEGANLKIFPSVCSCDDTHAHAHTRTVTDGELACCTVVAIHTPRRG